MEYEDLQSDHQALKSSHNQLKLQFAKLEAESSDIRVSRIIFSFKITHKQ